MGDQLIAFIKPDLVYEAKVVTKKLVKLATDAKPNIPKPVKQAPVQTPTVGRRGRSGQQQTDSTESNKENKEATPKTDKVEVTVPKKTPDSRRGKKGRNANSKVTPDNEDLDKLSLELTQDIVAAPVTKADKKDPPQKGRGRGRARGKENEVKEETERTSATEKSATDKNVVKAVVHNVNNKEVKNVPGKEVQQMPNAIVSPLSKVSAGVPTAVTGGRGKRKAPGKAKELEVVSVDVKKVKSNEDVVQNALTEKTIISNKKVPRRQNKKGASVISTLANVTKVGGVSLLGKGMPQLPTTPLPISLKKTVVGSILPTKIGMPTVQPGGKVVNIASLLPTSPNPRITSPTQIRPGAQQLIQIRPGNLQIQSQGPSLTGSNLVQIRPPNQVLNAIGSLRPQQMQAGGIGSAGSIIGAPGCGK